QMDGIASPITHDLNFDVTRLFEIFLDVNCVIAEGCAGFGAGGCKSDGKIFLAAGNLHAASATTGRSLDDDRIADFLGDAGSFHVVRSEEHTSELQSRENL